MNQALDNGYNRSLNLTPSLVQGVRGRDCVSRILRGENTGLPGPAKKLRRLFTNCRPDPSRLHQWNRLLSGIAGGIYIMGLLDELYTQQPGLLSSGNRLSGLLGEPINPIARRNRLADFGAKVQTPNRLSVLDILDEAALPTMMIPGVGDVTGAAADLNMYLNDPGSRTAGNYALSMAGLLPFVPGMVGSIAKVPDAASESERLSRMEEAGYVPGFWRGGKSPADGPFYTRDESAAVAFAARHPKQDVREYALNLGKTFDFNKSLTIDDIKPISDHMRFMGETNMARDFEGLVDDWGGAIPAPMFYQALDTHFDARDMLKRAGYNSIDAGQEIVMLDMPGRVRDAKRAAFKDTTSSNYLGGFAAGGLGLGAYLADTRKDDSVR